MKKRVKKFVNNFKTVIKKPEMLVLPGQLAFFFILSIVPTLTLVSYAASYLNLSFDVFEHFIEGAFGAELAKLIIPEINNVNISFGFIVILLIGFFFASNGCSSIIVTSNTIYGIKDQGFLRRRIKSMVMTIFLILLFIFILIVPLFGQKIIELLSNININSGVSNALKNIINILNGPLSWLIIFFFIKLLFTMAPDKNIPSEQTTYGALFTSFGWILATGIYSFYINHYNHYSIFYGGLANIIVLMLWVYLLANIFVIGLALNYRKDELKEISNNDLPKKGKNISSKKVNNKNVNN